MAPAGALLLLLLLLLGEGWGGPRRPGRRKHLEYVDDAEVSAPPELLALLPAAARATVTAGYTEEAGSYTREQLPLHGPGRRPFRTRGGATTSHEMVLIVGDTRYAWQDWSMWHCNCREGSMARVRDISYAVPGVRLDPAQFDILRFEREVCSYAVCGCDRAKHQCDLLALPCKLGSAHMCALRDIQHDQSMKRWQFWARVHHGLKSLWHSLKSIPIDKQLEASQLRSSR